MPVGKGATSIKFESSFEVFVLLESLGVVGRSAASLHAQCAPSSPVPRLPPLQLALCLASCTLTSSPRLTILCIASPLAPGWQTRMIGRHTLRMREPLAIVYSFGAATSDALRAGMVILG